MPSNQRLILTVLFLGLTVFLRVSNLVVGQKSATTTSGVTIQTGALQTSPCAKDKESGLPLPSSFLPNRLPDFQTKLKAFLVSGRYRNLNLCEDKGLRDTGPYVNSTSYGVHPTVKIYYSPAVVNWLLRTNPDDVIPDGGMIGKEQYAPPAARYQLQGPPLLRGWTIMIKDAKGAKDGWYWDESWAAQCVDNNNPPFAVPYGGFGLYCTRCHASAEKELTFSYIKNIKGFPGDFDTYYTDLSWASEPKPPPPPNPGPCTAPDSDVDGNRLPSDKIRVRFREKGFARHQLQGLNVSLLEMFRQFMRDYKSNGSSMLANQILGVRQNDYMTGLDDLSTAVDAFEEQAKSATADVALSPVSISNQKLIADVLVTNKAGHRLPSGVGFRRAFLELRVTDNSSGKTVWCSGCTNELGVITDGGGSQSKRLPSELFDVYSDGSKPANHDYPAPCNGNYLPGINPQYYQPHFYWDLKKNDGSPITRQDEVQIYEELNLNNQCALTTSFIRRDYQLKDNRLLPYGWTSTGPLRPDKTRYIPEAFLEQTHPIQVGQDPAYADGSGTNVVRYEVPLNGLNPGNLSVEATLYYQAIPPYYLNDRFRQAPDQPATQRLYYLTSNLQIKGTPIENWKFAITSSSQPVTVH
ncbi:MAG: hypothetical protein ABJC10_12790 [Acidobacteriota bacterium]